LNSSLSIPALRTSTTMNFSIVSSPLSITRPTQLRRANHAHRQLFFESILR
jgi:hypothetical protein